MRLVINTNFKIKKFSVKYMIIFLLSILPIIDSINGWLVTNGKTSIGTVYKLIIIMMLFLYVYKAKCFEGNSILRIFLVVGYIAISICFNVLTGGIILSIELPIKILFNYMIFELFMMLSKKKKITGNTILGILNINSIIMIICVLIPYIMKTGYKIYAGGLGYKAFFYSQNELTASLIILFYFCLYKVIMKIDIISLIQLGLIFVCVVITNMKSAIAACLVGIICLIVEYIRRKESKYKILFFVMLIVAVYFGANFFIEQINFSLQRQNALSTLYKHSVLATLTSGRIFYVQQAWNSLIIGKLFIIKCILGNGFCSNILCEMDFIDMFFYLGIIGVVVLSIFIIKLLKKSILTIKCDNSIIRLVGFIVIIGVSFVAGHIIFMATSGCYFIMFCCFNCLYMENKYGSNN